LKGAVLKRLPRLVLLPLAFALLTCSRSQPPVQTRLTAADGAQMALIPAGPFVMGSDEGQPDQQPPHRVDLPASYIELV